MRVVMVVRVGVPGFMLVLLLGLPGVNLLGEVTILEDVDLGCRDAAAIDLLNLQRGSDVEGGGGLPEDFKGDAGVDQGAEKHVACDSGEAI
jgi:hypothetical protein